MQIEAQEINDNSKSSMISSSHVRSIIEASSGDIIWTNGYEFSTDEVEKHNIQLNSKLNSMIPISEMIQPKLPKRSIWGENTCLKANDSPEHLHMRRFRWHSVHCASPGRERVYYVVCRLYSVGRSIAWHETIDSENLIDFCPPRTVCVSTRETNDFGVYNRDVGCAPVSATKRWRIKLSNFLSTVWCSMRYDLARYVKGDALVNTEFQLSEEIIDGDVFRGQTISNLKAHRLWIEAEGGTEWDLGREDKSSMTSAKVRRYTPWSLFGGHHHTSIRFCALFNTTRVVHAATVTILLAINQAKESRRPINDLE